MIILEDGSAQLTVEEVSEYNQLLEDAETVLNRIAELEQELSDAETKLEEAKVLAEHNEEDDGLSEEFKLLLESRDKEIASLRRKALKQEVDLIIAEATTYRDDNGRGHSPVLLELAKNALLGAKVGTDEAGDVIVLEDRKNGFSVAEYNRQIWKRVLSTVPGQVQFEPRTETDGGNEDPYELSEQFSKEDFASLWEA